MLTVYKASAGSGKTYTLAFEYIKQLLGVRRADGTYALNRTDDGIKRRHAGILAITFTNKATAEMKSRILKELDSLTVVPSDGGKDAPYAKGLMETFGCSREELAAAATTALRHLLNDYGAFNVSTIDAFFQTILRSFAREIDRQGDFRLEVDEGTALSQSMSMLFDEVNLNSDKRENKEIYHWLSEQSVERMKEGRDFNPFNRRSSMYGSIVKHLSGIFNESFTAREKEMSEYLSDPSRLNDFNSWLMEEIGRIEKKEKEVSSALLSSGIKLNTYLNRLLEKIVVNGCLGDEEYRKINKGAASPKYIVAIREGNEGEQARMWLETVVQCYVLRKVYDEIRSKIHNLRALNAIYAFIDRYRSENNLILISDSNTLLSTIIDGSDTPFIYERVGNVLENFLIDEFQDTSRMQWENLRSLVGNSLSWADSLIIGDEKQSIYRWRGGDPDLLSKKVAKTDFPKYSIVKGDSAGENTNYRSAHGIVRFNNTLFTCLASGEGLVVPGYTGVAQSLSQKTKDLTSYVRFNDLTPDNFENTVGELLTPEEKESLVNDNRYTPKDVALFLLAKTINRQIECGYRQSEIAILCAKRKEGVEIAEYLGRYHKNIRLVSEEALLLRNSTSVKIIISMLEILERSLDATYPENGGGDSSVSGGMESLFKDSAEEQRLRRSYILCRRRAALNDAFEYYIAGGTDVNEALNLAIEAANLVGESDRSDTDKDGVSDIEYDLRRIREMAPVNLSALVQAIIELKISMDERRREMPYITAFVDFVDEYIQNYNPTIHSFLAYWNENSDKAAIAPSVNDEAVTITTIHKAKGLEWACVNIPFMNWPFGDMPRDGWYDTAGIDCPQGITAPPIIYLETNSLFGCEGSPFRSQYEERAAHERTDNLNVAYVAFTRAVRELNVNMLVNSRASDPLTDHIRSVFMNPPSVDASDNKYLDFAPYVSDGGSFVMGEPTVPAREDRESDEIKIVDAPDYVVSFNDINSRITTRIDMTSELASESDDIASLGNEQEREIVDEPKNENLEKAAREGIIMHAILSRMNTRDDLGAAVAYCRGELSQDEMEKYEERLSDAFLKGGPAVERWFSAENLRVLNEQSIYNKRSGTITRADRIVWLPDGTVDVIDYKFTTTIKRAHSEQVRDYAYAVSKATGKTVKAFLWYPLLDKILPVD